MEELAQVYARSLFEVAREQNKLDVLREQLGQFADAMKQNRELELFFFSPYFSTKEKQEGLEKLLDGADDRFMNFLKLLIENHRMPVIYRLRREYERLWERENRLLPVVLTSAVELDQQTVKDLGDRIGERTVTRWRSPPGWSPTSSAGLSSGWAIRSSTPPSAIDSSNCARRSLMALAEPPLRLSRPASSTTND